MPLRSPRWPCAASLAYGGVPALADVSLVVAPGERRGIIGPNGAGKTTLFNAISGWARPDAGQVLFEGREIGHQPVERIVQGGLARTFQHAQLCWTLDVRQNIELAARASGLRGAQARLQVQRLVELIGLGAIACHRVADLSYGSQKQVELAVVLGTSPRVLLLDEPTAGLSSVETRSMLQVLRGLPQELTIVLIEHDMDVLFGLARNVTVLEAGRLIFDGTTAEVQRDARVREAYSGARKGLLHEPFFDDQSEPEAVPRPGEPASHFLQVQALVAGYGKNTVLEGLDLHVDRGASVCLLGRNGVGKTTAINTLFGFVRPTSGRIVLDGQDIAGWQTDRVGRAGVAVVPQGRRLFRQLSVLDDLRIAARGRPDAWSVDQCMERFPVLRTRAAVAAGALSGGEQQIVALVRALVTGPQLLLLDEPSEGLAPQMLDSILEILQMIKASGRSILIVEQNLHLGLGIADRVYVINKGRVVAQELPAALRSDEDLLHRLMGVSSMAIEPGGNE